MPEIPVGAAILGSSVLGAGSSIFGGIMGANAQSKAASQATAAEMAMFEQGLGIAKGSLQPFINAGQSTIPLLKQLTTPGADMTSTLEQTPGYKFALTQGEKGITNQATMTGLSGNAMRAGGEFASGLAQTTWSNVVDKLISQLGIGEQAGSSLSYSALGNATSTGRNIGENFIGAGNAQAGADIGIAGALGGAGNSVSQALMLNAMTGGKLFGATNGGAWGSVNSVGDGGTPAFMDATGGIQSP